MKRRLRLALLALFATATLLRATPPPDESEALLNDAWKTWELGDQHQTELKFLDVLDKDPSNARAHLGLSLLYSLQRRDDDARNSFVKALANEPNSYPFIFANWITPMLSGTEDGLEIKRALTSQSDSFGILKAMAHSVVGEYYERKNKVSSALEHYDAIGAVADWTLIGPFDNTSASGHLNVYPPESTYDVKANYKGKGGVPATWFPMAAVRLDKWIDFKRYFTDEDAVYYANTFVYSPERRTVQLRIGTSGSFRLFLNDEVVSEESEEMNNDLDTYIAETELQQGWNRVLVKCGLSEIQRCNFLLRLTDSHGEPLPGIKFATEPQTYASRPGAKHRTIENFAEAFFRQRIKEHPDHQENYLLLANCYLRNDKATEAELTLRDALRLAPKNVLLLDHQLEAFVRGRKYDEVQKTLDRIYAVDPRVPSAIEYKFNQHMETEEYDQAEKVLTDLEKVLGNRESVLEKKMRLYSAKEQIEQVIETIASAYKRFPTNLQFVLTQAYIDSRTTNSPDGSIGMIEDYLDHDYDPTTVRTLASVYLQSKSNMRKWRELNDNLIALDPAATGYLYEMSTTYFSIQQYDEAKELLERAIAICPGSALYWTKIGEIARIRGNNDEAIAAYRTALSFYPTDYETRAKLRELEGKRSIFEQIPAPNVDSAIAAAPSADEYPDNKGVILIEDSQRVVYEGGASETSQEFVVKLFNNLAIDDWKEYSIGYNGYSEELIVEKAVSIKPDGTEIKADVSGNELVFKSLEPEDIIRMKWRIKNHYAGRLSGHFWDTYRFDGFYPARHVRYSLLTPKDADFEYTAQNMDKEPTKTNVDDGVLYQWVQRDLPAISFEYGMPSYPDVAKSIHVSSIKDWSYLVDWYRDIARSKTKASFEVKEAVAELMKGKESASNTEKIHAVYDFITEHIRYSSVPFRQGSHIPQKARDVLVNRIGDCKDVATLCISMLGELGIQSHHVLVNTRDEGMNEVVLPSIPFNHCIVGVEHEGGIKYLDLTANNFPYGSLPEGDRGAFMLMVRPGVTGPEHLPSTGLMPRVFTVSATIDLSKDNALAGERRLEGTGALAAGIRGAFRDGSRKEQEKSMVASLGEEFPNAKLLSMEIDHVDAPHPTAGYTYRFAVPDYINDAGSFKMLKLPWRTSANADQALSYEKREHAYDYWPRADTISEKLVITLPAGMVPMDLPAKQELTSPIADYSISYALNGTTLTATRRYAYKKGVVTPNEYGVYKAFYNSVIKEDNRQILLQSGGKPGRSAGSGGTSRRN